MKDIDDIFECLISCWLLFKKNNHGLLEKTSEGDEKIRKMEDAVA